MSTAAGIVALVTAMNDLPICESRKRRGKEEFVSGCISLSSKGRKRYSLKHFHYMSRSGTVSSGGADPLHIHHRDTKSLVSLCSPPTVPAPSLSIPVTIPPGQHAKGSGQQRRDPQPTTTCKQIITGERQPLEEHKDDSPE